METKCGECRFWVSRDEKCGECHRHPKPWPQTDPDDWCGDAEAGERVAAKTLGVAKLHKQTGGF